MHCCVGDFVHTMEPEVGEDNTYYYYYYYYCAAEETQSLWELLSGRTFRVVPTTSIYKLTQTVTNIINSARAQVRKNVRRH